MRSTLDEGRVLRLSNPLARWDEGVFEVDEARITWVRGRRKLKFTLFTSFTPPARTGTLRLARPHGPLEKRVAVWAHLGRILEVREI